MLDVVDMDHEVVEEVLEAENSQYPITNATSADQLNFFQELHKVNIVDKLTDIL